MPRLSQLPAKHIFTRIIERRQPPYGGYISSTFPFLLADLVDDISLIARLARSLLYRDDT